MQVGVDVKCMHTNFGGHGFSGFGHIATFKTGQIFVSDRGLYLVILVTWNSFYYYFIDESHAPAIFSATKGLVGQWDIVGLYLGIENAKLEMIKYNYINDVDHCRKEMIVAWLRQPNATRQRLIKALKEAGRNDLAYKVKEL